MTREKAIQWLKVINTKEFGWDEFALQESQREIRERCEQGVREAIDMAIEALSERNIARDIATILENEQDMRVMLQNDAVNEDTQTERRVDHDRDWIIGCIKHDGFIKTDRFDKANQIILEALSADTVSRGAHYDAVANRITDMEERGFVSVVRCKDCIHWKADNEVFELGFCCVFPQKWVAETFYCADGERREP